MRNEPAKKKMPGPPADGRRGKKIFNADDYKILTTVLQGSTIRCE